DAAEFGLGMRLAVDSKSDQALDLVARLRKHVGEDLADALARGVGARDDEGIANQRQRVGALLERLAALDPEGVTAATSGLTATGRRRGARLRTLAETRVYRRSWSVGGDGWAYDIGSASLDQVAGSRRHDNLRVR